MYMKYTVHTFVIYNTVTCRVVHATNKTGSSSNDGTYYQLVTYSLVITLTHRQYSDISHLHELEFTVTVFFHHGFPVA
jgi:hypothetical protein